MKTIFGIYKRDLKNFFNNYITIIIFLGLLILPSLYAWINIVANWDPYNNTSSIKVAVINDDVGTTIGGNNINIGDLVIEKLKANDKIGWQFIDENTANQGILSGKYYAKVEIPKDFSKQILSITTDNIQRPQINYTVNEKKNAIAPKITNQGVTVLQEEINKEFIKSASQAVLTSVNLADENLSEYADNAIDKISTGLTQTSRDMDLLIAIMENIANGTALAKGSVNNVNSSLDHFADSLVTVKTDAQKNQQLITEGRAQAKISRDSIKDQLEQAKITMDLIGTQIDNAISIVDTSTDSAISALNRVSEITGNLMATNGNIIDALNSINTVLPVPSTKISAMISNIEKQNQKLSELNKNSNNTCSDIRNNQKITAKNRKLINDNINSLQNMAEDNWNNYINAVAPIIISAIDTTYDGLGNVISVLDRAIDNTPHTKEVLTNFSEGLDSTAKVLTSTQKLLNNSKESVDKLNNDITNLTDEDKVSKLVAMLINDPDTVSDFLASPVIINENKVYPMGNNGSAMTPFYTMLAIWVGGLILMAIIVTKVKEDMKFYKLSHKETYFSRFLLILTLALGQSLIVCLGDIFLINIYCVNKIMFVLTGLFCGFIFINIIFTLVSTFGNVGKAIAVIILVFQVAAAGGTFPVEMLPWVLRAINPILPFTYAIDAMRETIGGIYWPSYLKDILILSIYIPVSLSIALPFRNKMVQLVGFFEKKTKESGFIE